MITKVRLSMFEGDFALNADISPERFEQLALKTRKVELTGQVRLALASAAEAEKSAVLATTDEESLAFADQSRAATATAEEKRAALGKLL